MLRRPRRVAAALSGLALAASTATLVPGSPAAVAAEPGSPLSLWAPAKVIAMSYDGRAYTDFGLRVAAQETFEIRSSRVEDYGSPITSVWGTRAAGPDAPFVEQGTLPEGSMPTFAGLDNFVSLELTSLRTGETLPTKSLDGCLNGLSQRVDPDAQPRSPYPWGCPYNPFTLGSVMGVAQGHSTTLLDEWSRPTRLEPGRYDVTARISDTYTSTFGIAEADATRTFRLVVKREEEFYRPAAPRSTAPVEQAGERPTGAPMSTAAAEAGPTPDLRSLPAWDIQLNRGGTALRFAANVWNAGNSPLVIEGFREDGDDHLHTYQYFFDTEGNQVGRTPEAIGEMGWHAENHDHWHFEDFARYRLLQREGNTPDGAIVAEVKSTKQSFCLANTDAIDYTVPGADWQPSNTDLSTVCDGPNAQSLRQVLSAGSGDTYHQYRYGQAFRLKGVEDGVYFVSVEANPEGRLVESDYENNSSQRRVKIWTTPQGERRVKVFHVGVIDEHGSGMFRRAAR